MSTLTLTQYDPTFEKSWLRPCVARSSDFFITRMITDRIGLHSVLLPLLKVIQKQNKIGYQQNHVSASLTFVGGDLCEV